MYTVTYQVFQVWTQHHFVLVPRHWFSSTKRGKPLGCSEWSKIWHLKHNLTQVKILGGARMFNCWKCPRSEGRERACLEWLGLLIPKPLKKKWSFFLAISVVKKLHMSAGRRRLVQNILPYHWFYSLPQGKKSLKTSTFPTKWKWIWRCNINTLFFFPRIDMSA